MSCHYVVVVVDAEQWLTGHGGLLQGSFVDGTFATYMPALRDVELCDVPEIE